MSSVTIICVVGKNETRDGIYFVFEVYIPYETNKPGSGYKLLEEYKKQNHLPPFLWPSSSSLHSSWTFVELPIHLQGETKIHDRIEPINE